MIQELCRSHLQWSLTASLSGHAQLMPLKLLRLKSIFLRKWFLIEQHLLSTSVLFYVFLSLFAHPSKGQETNSNSSVCPAWICMCGPVLRRSPRLLASYINWFKGIPVIFPISEGLVVVPFKFTSTRMFKWEVCFRMSRHKSQTGQWKAALSALLRLILTQRQLTWCWSAHRWRVLSSLGIPVAGPIRPGGSAAAAGISSRQWWAPGAWRARALQAQCNLPNHSHQTPLSQSRCRANAHRGPAIHFCRPLCCLLKCSCGPRTAWLTGQLLSWGGSPKSQAQT